MHIMYYFNLFVGNKILDAFSGVVMGADGAALFKGRQIENFVKKYVV